MTKEIKDLREELREKTTRLEDRVDHLSEVLISIARLDERFLKMEEHRIKDSEERREMLKEIQSMKISVSHNTEHAKSTRKLFWTLLTGVGTVVVIVIAGLVLSLT